MAVEVVLYLHKKYKSEFVGVILVVIVVLVVVVVVVVVMIELLYAADASIDF